MRLWFKGSGSKMKPGLFGHQSHCPAVLSVFSASWKLRDNTGQVQNTTLVFSATSHTWREVSIKNRDKPPNRYKIRLTQFSPIVSSILQGKQKAGYFYLLNWKHLVRSKIYFSVTGHSSNPLELSFKHKAYLPKFSFNSRWWEAWQGGNITTKILVCFKKPKFLVPLKNLYFFLILISQLYYYEKFQVSYSFLNTSKVIWSQMMLLLGSYLRTLSIPLDCMVKAGTSKLVEGWAPGGDV